MTDHLITKSRRFTALFTFPGITLFTLLLVLPEISFSQESTDTEYRTIQNDAFQAGEFLKYKVYYDSWLTYWMTAGIGTMQIEDDAEFIDGREAFKIEVTGKSTGVFTLFYKVRDYFVSYLDKQAIVSHKFNLNKREGKFRQEDEISFDHKGLTARSKNKVTDIPANIQDIVSAFYFVRTFDFDTAKVNDEYFIDFFLDDSVYQSKIIFLGREWIETSLGKFYCMGFKPKVAQGDLFKEPYPMYLWVTDDENRIPILGVSKVYIGSITIELIEYEGLKHPLGAKEVKAE